MVFFGEDGKKIQLQLHHLQFASNGFVSTEMFVSKECVFIEQHYLLELIFDNLGGRGQASKTQFREIRLAIRQPTTRTQNLYSNTLTV